jgi:hypothetical protein
VILDYSRSELQRAYRSTATSRYVDPAIDAELPSRTTVSLLIPGLSAKHLPDNLDLLMFEVILLELLTNKLGLTRANTLVKLPLKFLEIDLGAALTFLPDELTQGIESGSGERIRLLIF